MFHGVMFRRVQLVLISLVMLPGCAVFKQKETLESLDHPINCATAEGDLRVLEHEKAHVAQQIVEGVTAITPAGAVIGILTGTEGTKLQVGIGEYNRKIDERIAAIKSHCGLK